MKIRKTLYLFLQHEPGHVFRTSLDGKTWIITQVAPIYRDRYKTEAEELTDDEVTIFEVMSR